MKLKLQKEGFEDVEILEDTQDNENNKLLVTNKEVRGHIFATKWKKSFVWKYFIQLRESLFVCAICDQRIVVHNTNTQTFNKHMTRRHYKVHRYEVRKQNGTLNSVLVQKTDIKNEEELAAHLGQMRYEAILENDKMNQKITKEDVKIRGKKDILERINSIKEIGVTFENNIETDIDYTKLEAAYVLSKKGNPVLTLGPYTFYKVKSSKINPTRFRWICKNSQKGCTVTITTQDDRIVKISNRHNHYPIYLDEKST